MKIFDFDVDETNFKIFFLRHKFLPFEIIFMKLD